MSNGIRITKQVTIPEAQDTDFVLDSLKQGGMKIHEIKVFKRGGELTDMGLGYQAYTQKYEHGLGYAPAYFALKGAGDISVPTYVTMPDNNFASVIEGDFCNVDDKYVYVGFDTAITSYTFIRVIIFEERLE